MAVLHPNDSNANINALVELAFIEGIVPQVMLQNPLLTKLLEKKRIVWKGGKNIMGISDTAEVDDHMQAYVEHEAMTAKRTTTLDNPYWDWKFTQIPIVYTMKEKIQASAYSRAELVSFLVNKANRSARNGLRRMAYGVPFNSVTPYTIGTDTEGTDNSAGFQSIRQALTHDATYGHVTRTISSGTNTWFQSADIDDFASSASAQTTETEMSPDNFEKAKDAIMEYASGNAGRIALMGPSLFRGLKSYCEAKRITTAPGSMAKYGYESMEVFGIECVKDYFLKNKHATNSHLWLFILTPDTWRLQIHPDRSFKFTGFTWQGDKPDGKDEWLARIMLAGNLVCTKPNENFFHSNFV